MEQRDWFYGVGEEEAERRKKEVDLQNILVEECCILFQVKRLFLSADKDGDGKLTVDEWVHLLGQSGVESDR